MDLNYAYDSQCEYIDSKFGGLSNIKWRKGDEETWDIISLEYEHHIRPTMRDMHAAGLIRGSSVIQAGGNCGLYPVCLTEFFHPVITFEPNPVNFYCLVNNCQTPNVIKINAAVGRKTGRVKSVEIHPSNFGMSKVEDTDDGTYVPMVTIDSFDFTDVGMIQLDTEGYEYDALVGATKTIKNNKPVIMLESTNSKIEKFLDKLGYVLYKKIGHIDSIYVSKDIL